MKPNYLVIGAAKCATSSLCSLLGSHPDVFMVECKEPYFFNLDEHYFGKGWRWYQSLYASAGACKMRGEGSNGYTMKELYPDTAQRIARDLPDAKLIYIVRHPLRRIESYWTQLRANGDRDVSPDFDRAVRTSTAKLVDSTNYLTQIDAFRAYFPDQRILVLFYEDFRANSGQVMRRCFEFLGVDPDADLPDSNQHLNASNGKLVYTGMLTRMQNLPGFKTIMRPFPESWKTAVRKRFFRTRTTGRPAWKPETRNEVLQRIGDDCQSFLERYGRPPGYWGLQGMTHGVLAESGTNTP